jgi:tRNA/rRNA methyltransferase
MDIDVVLVEPEGDENVGAVARAMMNMDAARLILVNPQCNHLSEKARCYAVHAREYIENALLVNSLGEAFQGSAVRAAITRRTGQYRKRDFDPVSFSEFLERYRDQRVTLVFGREKHGLTTDEIQECDVVVGIESSERFPSLNLAQSVMVILYETFRARKLWKNDDRAQGKAVPREEFDTLMDRIIETVRELGLFRMVPEWRLRYFIRKVLSRASLDHFDVLVIRRLFDRIRGAVMGLKKSLKKD